jgi:hypothetical protein
MCAMPATYHYGLLGGRRWPAVPLRVPAPQ